MRRIDKYLEELGEPTHGSTIPKTPIGAVAEEDEEEIQEIEFCGQLHGRWKSEDYEEEEKYALRLPKKRFYEGNTMNRVDKYLEQLQTEDGFEKYPKGWTRKSVRKFARSLAGGGKKVGFFEKCVKKMKGKMKDPEGFCAAVKDEAHASTYWRGKGKKPAEVKKAIARHKKI